MANPPTTPPPRPDGGRAQTSATQGARGYKRSWKNLLLNKQYQLQFTLFMVAVSAVLIAGLGYWVMKVANKTTAVGITRVRGEPCPEVPSLAEAIANGGAPADAPVPAGPGPGAPGTDDLPGRDAAGSAAAVDAGSAAAGSAAAGANGSAAGSADANGAAGEAVGSGADAAAGSAAAADADDEVDDEEAAEERRRRRPRIVVDETSMTLTAIAPPGFVEAAVARWSCELRHAGPIAQLERGRRSILIALVLSSVILILGLGVYGIKMTHKVAGPLFKVSLYLAKMQQGRLDKVWNLRKGDQLMAFYEHFKAAHAGLVTMQQEDLATARALLAVAEAEGWAARSTDVAAQLEALAELVAKKEKSLE